MSAGLLLYLFSDRMAVCRLDAGDPLPDWARPGDLLAIIRTREELSVVCHEADVPTGITAEAGWRMLKVAGPLEFSMVGVLSSIAEPMAAAGVSIYTISTYDTDYILVKEKDLKTALGALWQAGHRVQETVVK
jgi:hypothetical protein